MDKDTIDFHEHFLICGETKYGMSNLHPLLKNKFSIKKQNIFNKIKNILKIQFLSIIA
jgi:hypothetical protein